MQKKFIGCLLLFLSTSGFASWHNCCACLFARLPIIQSVTAELVTDHVSSTRRATTNLHQIVPTFDTDGKAAILYSPISVKAQEYQQPISKTHQFVMTKHRIFSTLSFPPIS